MIKVRAIQKGFYGQLRIPGDLASQDFEIDNEKAFSKRWMVKLSKPKKAKEKEPETDGTEAPKAEV